MANEQHQASETQASERAPVFSRADCGCYIGSASGIYGGEEIQDLARSYGWDEKGMTVAQAYGERADASEEENEEGGEEGEGSEEGDRWEEYYSLMDEAEEFLQSLCDDSCYWEWRDGDFFLSPSYPSPTFRLRYRSDGTWSLTCYDPLISPAEGLETVLRSYNEQIAGRENCVTPYQGERRTYWDDEHAGDDEAQTVAYSIPAGISIPLVQKRTLW